MTDKQSTNNVWGSHILRRYSLFNLHRQGLGMTITYFILFLAVGVFVVNNVFLAESPLRNFAHVFNYFVVVVAILNIVLIYYLRKISDSILIYDYLLKEVEFDGNTEITTAFFPFIATCYQKLKRPDMILWTAIICSYFQERNLSLDRVAFCGILKEIVENKDVNTVMQEEYGIKANAEHDLKSIQKLSKTLAPNVNIITWQRFYGWRTETLACDSLVYFRKRTDRGFGVSDSLTLLPYTKKMDFDDFEIRRQRYSPVATIVRGIVEDYMDQLQHPVYYCYPKSGDCIQTGTVENHYFTKR